MGAVGARGPHFGERRGVHRRCGPSHRQAESRGEKGGKYKREEPEWFLPFVVSGLVSRVLL